MNTARPPQRAFDGARRNGLSSSFRRQGRWRSCCYR